MKLYILKKIKLLSISMFCLFVINSFAAELDSHLENADSLRIGTPFHLVVDINSALHDSLYIPPIDTLDIFVLAGRPKISEQSINADSLLTSINFTFQPFDVGDFILPEIDFMLRSDGELSSLTTPEYNLKIYSTVPDSVKVISDIASPKSIYLGFWDYLAIFLALGIIALIIYYLSKLFRKREIEEIEARFVDTRPAYEICLEQVEKLKKADYLRHGDFLSYYFRLSYILRLFMELQFRMRALEMTSAEIRTNLTKIDPNEKSLILNFLLDCDKIKFAKFHPNLKAADIAIDELENYLSTYKNQEDNDA